MENSNMKFQVIGDERGSLISLEAIKNIPFNIKRVYYIYNVDPKLPRGFHAHLELQQVLVCVSGSCKVILDDGHVKSEHILNEPDQGILVDKMVWHEMHNFSEDCILMVLASDIYKEEDYIRNFDDFRTSIKGKSISNNYFSHEKSLVETNNIGENTKIWAYTHVFPGAEIGENCNINDHTLIENDVVLGNNVTVKSGVHIWDGVRIGNNVFIGPSVVFTNDLNPRSKRYPEKFAQTIINNYASIGANSTIVAGNIIGEYAMIGAGSVVTKDVPPYTLWYGNPAVFRGYVCECGNKLNSQYICQLCNKNFKDKIEFI
ncbi:WxcM-like domain-containing protein [Psychrobacillus sp. FSL K6-1415]|uniref:WxcM-like domain-containing protein n=1 Tax=Psychrobacillus sp. FSL K6-1415 TaxID=2921544 RepID=UPI0030F8C12E